ncbi:MAG: hypothetical protein ABR953_10405 [Candidatus Acidiferrales bacterium]|jgi:hypothetical protein
MFHNEDTVEEITTRRQGKIGSIGSEIKQGRETQNLWRVVFSDGKAPGWQNFKNEAELRLIKCPHNEPESGIYPADPIV